MEPLASFRAPPSDYTDVVLLKEDRLMRILAPVDQSARDCIALPYCVELAENFGAVVVLVHVVPVTHSLLPGAMREAEAYVGAVADCLREEDVTVETIVRRGDPATAIVDAAEEARVDIIVMTSRGRSNLGKLILGSVTDAVLARCPKPVILLSELANGKNVDELVRRKSVYLATFIWNKKARGLYSEIEARAELDRLVLAGLDRNVLHGTYNALEDHGAPLGWLDLDFQQETLRAYLPQELGEDDAPDLPGLLAA